jgi:tetratricopeptide (TPR) repeat protein
MGNNQAAMEMYAGAIEVGGEPEMIRAASINMAELLRQEGRGEEALAIYSDYAAAHPDDVLGTLNYAVALMDVGDQEAAEQIFRDLLGRDDLSFRQWSQVGIGLYRAQDFEQAAVAFERAHEMSPLNKETMENLANTYYQAERYQELIPIAGELVERFPLESVNYNLLANAERELENADAALEALEQRDALEFEFLRSQLSMVSEGVYSVEGQVMNKSGATGAEVTVPVELLGDTGDVVASDELVITLPGEGETASFMLQFEVEEPVAGFQYGPAGA